MHSFHRPPFPRGQVREARVSFCQASTEISADIFANLGSWAGHKAVHLYGPIHKQTSRSPFCTGPSFYTTFLYCPTAQISPIWSKLAKISADISAKAWQKDTRASLTWPPPSLIEAEFPSVHVLTSSAQMWWLFIQKEAHPYKAGRPIVDGSRRFASSFHE